MTMGAVRVCAVLMLMVAGGACLAQSLFDEDRFQALTADRRALRAGDALTVLVYETSSASQSADTTTSKNGGLSLGAGLNLRSYSAKLSAGEESSGGGRIQRTGRLAAQITVIVSDVLDNGDLRVSGRQQIMVNGEKQLLKLSGRVRPIDIGDGNTVVSTRLADAEIDYVGDGVLAEKQRQGLLTRIFSWLGLL